MAENFDTHTVAKIVRDEQSKQTIITEQIKTTTLEVQLEELQQKLAVMKQKSVVVTKQNSVAGLLQETINRSFSQMEKNRSQQQSSSPQQTEFRGPQQQSSSPQQTEFRGPQQQSYSPRVEFRRSQQPPSVKERLITRMNNFSNSDAATYSFSDALKSNNKPITKGEQNIPVLLNWLRNQSIGDICYAEKYVVTIYDELYLHCKEVFTGDDDVKDMQGKMRDIVNFHRNNSNDSIKRFLMHKPETETLEFITKAFNSVIDDESNEKRQRILEDTKQLVLIINTISALAICTMNETTNDWSKLLCIAILLLKMFTYEIYHFKRNGFVPDEILFLQKLWRTQNHVMNFFTIELDDTLTFERAEKLLDRLTSEYSTLSITMLIRSINSNAPQISNYNLLLQSCLQLISFEDDNLSLRISPGHLPASRTTVKQIRFTKEMIFDFIMGHRRFANQTLRIEIDNRTLWEFISDFFLSQLNYISTKEFQDMGKDRVRDAFEKTTDDELKYENYPSFQRKEPLLFTTTVKDDQFRKVINSISLEDQATESELVAIQQAESQAEPRAGESVDDHDIASTSQFEPVKTKKKKTNNKTT